MSRRRSWMVPTLVLFVLVACEGARDSRAAVDAVVDAAPRRDSASETAPDSIRAAVLRGIRARLPGFDIELGRDVQHIGAMPFSWTMARYQARGAEFPYGSAIAVWHDARPASVWLHARDGDYFPHTMAWRDLDGDGTLDLFFLAGEEEVFETGVFLWRDTTAPAHARTLVETYADSNDYATLVDLDADGVPELLDPNVPGNDYPDEPETGPCDGFGVPEAVSARAQAEYDRIGRGYVDANFTYGMPRFGFSTLHLASPVRVLQFRAGEARDATAMFPGHLRWRIALLEEASAGRPAECRSRLDSTVAYLRARLGGTR